MTNNNSNPLTIAKRMQLPTPPFFKKLRTAGIVLAAVGGAIIGAPEGLPEVVLKIAGYLTLSGGIVSTISQMTVQAADPVTTNEPES